MKKRLFFIFSLVLITVFSSFAPVFASASAPAFSGNYSPDFDVTANGIYLYNIDTESVIYEKNSDLKQAPASLTKLMTFILALENTKNLDSEILTYPTYVQDALYIYQYIDKNGTVSNADLRAGDKLTMREALYALMLPSANEVAMMIADHVAGSQEAFVDMMNKKARELGAFNTNFTNPSGLSNFNYSGDNSGHYSTAYDMFLITQYALNFPELMDIANTASYAYTKANGDKLTWDSTNFMIKPENKYYYSAVRGVKTGTLPEEGRCFISTASKNGFTYVLVLLNADYRDSSGKVLDEQMAFVETRKIYDWVFDTFRVKTVLEKGKHIDEVTLELNLDKDHVKLMAGDNFSALMPKDIEASSVKLTAVVPDFIEAPVVKNQEIGEVILTLGGEELGRVKLLSAESVEASQVLVVLKAVKTVFKSFWFKFAVVFIVLLIVLYIFLMIIKNKNNRNRGYKPRRRI